MKRATGLLIVIILIVIAIFLLRSPSTEETTLEIDNSNTGINIGDKAPDFILSTPSGQSIQLSKINKPLVINFWASWCPFCIDELPLFQTEYNAGKVEVLAINLQEPKEDVLTYFEENSFTLPVLLDPNSQAKKLYNVFTQPVTYFLDSNNIIREKKFGPLTEEEFQEKLSTITSIETSDKTTNLEDEILITDGVKHIVPLEDIHQGCLTGKDCIPSIDNPLFESAEQADEWLSDNDVIFGINIYGTQIAYPQRILNWHEIVNHKINNNPVLITFCPLCGTAIAFDPTINGETHEFGVSGKLYNSDLVMYDRTTESYWNQVSGKAIVGNLVGEKLKKLPLDTLQWKDWLAQHPNTKVLSRKTGHIRDYSKYPYGDYETSSRVIFPVDNTDSRLHEKEVVYGIEIGGSYKAYQLSKLNQEQQDEFNGIKLKITNNKGIVKFINIENNEEIVPVRGFWFAWVALYPNTEIY